MISQPDAGQEVATRRSRRSPRDMDSLICLSLIAFTAPGQLFAQSPPGRLPPDQLPPNSGAVIAHRSNAAEVSPAPAPGPVPGPFAPLSSGELQAPSPQLTGGIGASLGVTHGSYSAAPAMIGDSFGGSFLLDEPNSGSSSPIQTVSIAGGDRRFKIAENVSPIPRDRVFFNYNHFENALNDHLGRSIALDRYTAGIEKTVWDELASIELRLPVAQGLNSTQDFASNDTRGAELSNLSMAFKGVLIGGTDWLISGGSTLTLPTGDGYVEAFAGDRNFFVDNDAVHLAPFIGWLVLPRPQWFAQGFVQTDFDLNGNEVRSSASGHQGVLQDQNLLFVDASIGRWLMRRSARPSRLGGIAAIAELHYTMTMNEADYVGGIGNPYEHVDVLNLTAALHFQFGTTSIRLGGAAPLRDDEERLYDAEIIAQWSRGF